MRVLAALEISEDNYSYCNTNEEKLESLEKDLRDVDADSLELIQIPDDVTLSQINNILMNKYESVMMSRYNKTFEELEKGEDPLIEER